MAEHPQNENDASSGTSGEDRRGLIPSGRLGIPIWFPPLLALLLGTVATFALWHRREDATALILVAICAGLGLVVGTALWLVDRFGPAPYHSAALPTFSLGAIFLLLATMFSYDREIWLRPWMATAGLLLALWCGGYSFAFLRVWLGLPNADRLSTRLASIGALCIAILFLSITLRDMLASARGLKTPTPEEAIVAACIGLWIATAGLFLWTQRRRLTAGTLLTILLWPAMLFLRAPLLALVAVALVIGLAYAGTTLGNYLGFPYAGVFIAMALLPATVATLAQSHR